MLTLNKVPGNCGLVTLSGNDRTTFTKEEIRTLLRNYEIENNCIQSIRKIMAFTTEINGKKRLYKAGFKRSDYYQGNSSNFVTIMLWDRDKNMKVVIPFKTKLKTFLTNLINKL